MSRDHSLIFFLFILSAPFDVTCESDQFSDLLSLLDNTEDLFNTSASEPEIPTDMLMDQTEPIPSEKNQVSIENPVELSASKQTDDSEYQDQLSVSTQTDVFPNVKINYPSLPKQMFPNIKIKKFKQCQLVSYMYSFSTKKNKIV